MATDRANDLNAFKSFIDEQLSSETVPTVDEVLARWEYENESDAERQESLESIRRGLADIEVGRVMPAREAVAELRRRHHLPELSCVSDGFRGYHFFGEVGTTCDTHVSRSRRRKRPQLTGVGRLRRRERAPWGWVRLAEKVEPFQTETDTETEVKSHCGHPLSTWGPFLTPARPR